MLISCAAYIIYFWMVRETVGACTGRVLSGGKGPLVFTKVIFNGLSLCRLESRKFLMVRI